jgi:hypothetical protein
MVKRKFSVVFKMNSDSNTNARTARADYDAS